MEIWSNTKLLNSLKEITESEEDRYSDIPHWKGEYLAESPGAVLLRIGHNEVWMPKSQLRIAEDRQSIYASNFILEAKGI